jgi:histone acetyltransferase (RNA polymerase elongator complex component)
MNIIPIFLPHGGCKTRCTFCNEYVATGQYLLPGRDEIISTVKRYLSYFKNKEDVQLAFYGGTFAGISNMKDFLLITRELYNSGMIKGFRVSTSPASITSETVRQLAEYPLTFVEMGVQSFNRNVLKACNRDHSLEKIYESAHILREFRVPFGVHLMTGLPEDSEVEDLFSAIETVRIGAVTARIHPLVILKGSALEESFNRGLFIPPSLDASVEILWKMFLLLEGGGVKVSRIGICLYGEQIEEVVAGPYHPALGELVRNRIMLEVIRRFAETEGESNLVLHNSHKKDFVGHRRYIVNLASQEGLAIEFSRSGKLVDIGYYDRLIREKLLREVVCSS